ncbi:hypothetical protein K431DRAFT_42579 [Polychaeton citri CBS 116435]|uniref:Uncharacterized protein n=1 Tax=Polychaeton citri CBS 116435 TaxID=1314669 RepID=A0A9P4UNR8_9PEZI|nr:hypothetical protein K431DRAFT_42579 [Polychaeton citri CBS 116435]
MRLKIMARTAAFRRIPLCSAFSTLFSLGLFCMIVRREGEKLSRMASRSLSVGQSCRKASLVASFVCPCVWLGARCPRPNSEGRFLRLPASHPILTAYPSSSLAFTKLGGGSLGRIPNRKSSLSSGIQTRLMTAAIWTASVRSHALEPSHGAHARSYSLVLRMASPVSQGVNVAFSRLGGQSSTVEVDQLFRYCLRLSTSLLC